MVMSDLENEREQIPKGYYVTRKCNTCFRPIHGTAFKINEKYLVRLGATETYDELDFCSRDHEDEWIAHLLEDKKSKKRKNKMATKSKKHEEDEDDEEDQEVENDESEEDEDSSSGGDEDEGDEEEEKPKKKIKAKDKKKTKSKSRDEDEDDEEDEPKKKKKGKEKRTLKPAGIPNFNKTEFFCNLVEKNRKEGIEAKEVANALAAREEKKGVKRPTMRSYVYAILGRLVEQGRLRRKGDKYFPAKKAA